MVLINTFTASMESGTVIGAELDSCLANSALTLLPKNFKQACENKAPCSLILSCNHFSRLRYSRRVAKAAKSIVNKKG